METRIRRANGKATMTLRGLPGGVGGDDPADLLRHWDYPDEQLTDAERTERDLLRLLAALPGGVTVYMSGGSMVITVDGE